MQHFRMLRAENSPEAIQFGLKDLNLLLCLEIIRRRGAPGIE
jgi:hypothetical protein